jgi:hypothetical protein
MTYLLYFEISWLLTIFKNSIGLCGPSESKLVGGLIYCLVGLGVVIVIVGPSSRPTLALLLLCVVGVCVVFPCLCRVVLALLCDGLCCGGFACVLCRLMFVLCNFVFSCLCSLV